LVENRLEAALVEERSLLEERERLLASLEVRESRGVVVNKYGKHWRVLRVVHRRIR